jgi:hypothetical protein
MVSTELAALAQIRATVTATVRTLGHDAGARAMQALLYPGQHRFHTGAFFREAKARRLQFALRQLENALKGPEPFAERMRNTAEFIESCRRHFAREAYHHTHALMGRDPTTDAYIASRVVAVQAQGQEEAYSDLLEMLDEVAPHKVARA